MSGPFSQAAEKAKAAELAQVEEVEEQEVVDPKEEAEKEKKAFLAGLKERFGDSAPDEKQLNRWKNEAGRIRWIELNSDEIYFFRPFRANEYRAWYKGLEQLGQTDPNKADELLKEKIVCTCVLFPKIDPETTAAQFAGTIDTLYAQIRLASNFIPFEQALMMVREWNS